MSSLWAMLQRLAGLFGGISSRLDTLQIGQANILTGEVAASQQIDLVLQNQATQAQQLNLIQETLALILAAVSPPPAVGFTIELTQETDMKQAVKAGLDFDLQDNGQAIATLTVVDAAGLATTLPDGVTPSWASSDPGVVVTPAADGLTATVSPATPPVLVTGAVITVSATLPDSTVITGTSQGIDVVAGGAAGFTIALK